MRWIESAGGPLVLVPRSALHEWRGVAQGGDAYEAACAVADYVGAIQWRGIGAIVFNDAPLSTTVVKDEDVTMAIRWIYAPNEFSILELLPRLRADLHMRTPDEVVFSEFREPEYILFDAGADGANLAEGLSVELVPGGYSIQTYVFKPSEDLGLLVHLFTRDATTEDDGR
jgi:hypothetical protein